MSYVEEIEEEVMREVRKLIADFQPEGWVKMETRMVYLHL